MKDFEMALSYKITCYLRKIWQILTKYFLSELLFVNYTVSIIYWGLMHCLSTADFQMSEHFFDSPDTARLKTVRMGIGSISKKFTNTENFVRWQRNVQTGAWSAWIQTGSATWMIRWRDALICHMWACYWEVTDSS